MLVICEHGQMPDFDGQLGNEEHCCYSPTGKHEPSNAVSVESDGGTLYVDVSCMHCGRSGCVAKLTTESVDW